MWGDQINLVQHCKYHGCWCPGYLCCKATREINTKITLQWAQEQFVMRVQKLFYFLHDITRPQMMIKMTIFTHHPRVSLAQFSFCWWCHSQLLMTSQWPDNCDVIMLIVLSNSLDIDFIQFIHSRLCKKIQNPVNGLPLFFCSVHDTEISSSLVKVRVLGNDDDLTVASMRNHSQYRLSQWEKTLLCNTFSEPIPRMIPHQYEYHQLPNLDDTKYSYKLTWLRLATLALIINMPYSVKKLALKWLMAVLCMC